MDIVVVGDGAGDGIGALSQISLYFRWAALSLKASGQTQAFFSESFCFS